MVSKAEKSQVTGLFNLYCEAYGEDPSDRIHALKQAALRENGITDDSRKLLQEMAKLRQDMQKNQRKDELHVENRNMRQE
ncbi:hypothetical protein EP56_01725 [Listeriaceae bacterium FSL A5-0209]|nr:hypothetical protein EP56_01725 [Listeriaceae bacterium FSL A5-0209]